MQILKIKSIKRIPKTDRYDLTVNSTHNFFANGILIHNTSGISAYVLCQPKPSKWVDLAIWLTNHTVYALANLFSKDTKYFSTQSPRYDYVYASRTVIKNKYYNTHVSEGYYGCDVWAEADKILRPHMDRGMSLYYEIIGFLPNGGYIQKGYDYGY